MGMLFSVSIATLLRRGITPERFIEHWSQSDEFGFVLNCFCSILAERAKLQANKGEEGRQGCQQRVSVYYWNPSYAEPGLRDHTASSCVTLQHSISSSLCSFPRQFEEFSSPSRSSKGCPIRLTKLTWADLT